MGWFERFRFDIRMWNAAKAKYRNIDLPQDADGIIEFVLGKVPKCIREAYDEDGMRLEFCPHSDVQNTVYAAYLRKGRGRTWAWWNATQTMGTYRPDAKVIQISRKTLKHSIFDYPDDWKNHIDTAGHEIGHYVDYICGLPHRRRSFMEAYEAERGKFSSYAADSPSEYFADCFWLACMYPEEAADEIPCTYAWFDEYLNS